MTVFQPISIKKAYEILRRLPAHGNKEEFIELISQNFEVSSQRAKMYLRALKEWGFIRGTKELTSDQSEFDDFIKRLREKILEELPHELINLLLRLRNDLVPFSDTLLLYYLRREGVNLSLWKLRLIIKYLKFVGILYEIKTVSLVEQNSLHEGISELLKKFILQNAGITLDRLIKNAIVTYPLNACDIKKVLFELTRKNIITIDVTDEILNLWLQTKNPCDVLIIKKQENPETFDKIISLAELDKRISEIILLEKGTLKIKQWEGKFIVIPIKGVSSA